MKPNLSPFRQFIFWHLCLLTLLIGAWVLIDDTDQKMKPRMIVVRVGSRTCYTEWDGKRSWISPECAVFSLPSTKDKWRIAPELWPFIQSAGQPIASGSWAEASCIRMNGLLPRRRCRNESTRSKGHEQAIGEHRGQVLHCVPALQPSDSAPNQGGGDRVPQDRSVRQAVPGLRAAGPFPSVLATRRQGIHREEFLMGMGLSLGEAGDGHIDLPFFEEDGRGDGYVIDYGDSGRGGAGLYHGWGNGDGRGSGMTNYWFYGDGRGIGWNNGFALLICNDPLWLICAGAIK